MSGHSKWHRIKHKKAATDSKRGKLFGQLSRDIRIAAREERDPSKNNTLREAIERAKKFNLPQANIDRILNQDANETHEVVYEGYGVSGTALLIEAVTDNTNRTVAELRSALKKHGGSLGEKNSVLWKFKPRVIINANTDKSNVEDLELSLIDAGALDITVEKDELTVTTSLAEAKTLSELLLASEAYNVVTSNIFTVEPDQQIKLTPEQSDKLTVLVNELLESDDVEAVYTDAA